MSSEWVGVLHPTHSGLVGFSFQALFYKVCPFGATQGCAAGPRFLAVSRPQFGASKVDVEAAAARMLEQGWGPQCGLEQ